MYVESKDAFFIDSDGVATSMIGAGGGDVDQNLWNSIEGDTGNTTATSTTSGLNFVGGTNVTTTVSGDTITIDAGGAGGDVFKVGTPVDDELGVWTGDGTIEGEPNLTFDDTSTSVGLLTVGGVSSGLFGDLGDVFHAQAATAVTGDVVRAVFVDAVYSGASDRTGAAFTAGLNAFGGHSGNGDASTTMKSAEMMGGRYASILGNNSATINRAAGVSAYSEILTGFTGTIDNAIGILAEGNEAGSGLITNSYGIFVKDHLVESGTITNGYGIWIDTIDNAGTLNFPIYTEGGKSHFDDIEAVGTDLQFGTDTASTNAAFTFKLPADKNITIDGRNFPREITLGAFRINHTPEAATQNTRAVFLDVDYNSVPNTEAMHVGLLATNMAAGETMIGVDIEGDMNASSGGVVRGINIGKIVGAGSGEMHGIHIEPEVDEVITHASGSFGTILQGWDENGGFTDTTAAFNSSGTDVTIFSADDDKIYIGSASAFSVIAYVLNTAASNPGIKPTFEFSIAGPAWTTFTPVDGTAGFREDGLIDWDIDDLTNWVSVTVNGQAAFYIRITRTQAVLGTAPVEDLFEISTPTNYNWDKNGKLFVGSVTTGVSSNTITTEGVSETTQMIAHINDAFTETIEHTLMRHSDTVSAGSILYGIRTRGTHVAATTIQDDDKIFEVKVAGHDGTDFNDAGSIAWYADGGISANDMPTRIEFSTTPDATNTPALAFKVDSSQNLIVTSGEKFFTGSTQWTSAGADTIAGTAVENASLTQDGVVELATTAEIDAGSDSTRAMPVDQFEDSAFGLKTVSLLINDSTALTTGDGKIYFRAPDILNGWSISDVTAARVFASDTDIQINLFNVTQNFEVLSTTLWIEHDEFDSDTAGTPTVINTSNDALTTADRFRVDVDQAGTATTWLEVQIGFERIP